MPVNTPVSSKIPSYFVQKMGFDPEKPFSALAPPEQQLWQRTVGAVSKRAQEIIKSFAGRPIEKAVRFMSAESRLTTAANEKVRAARLMDMSIPANREAYARAAFESLPHSHNYIATRAILSRLFLDRIMPQMPEEQKMRFLFTMPETFDPIVPNQYRQHAIRMIRAERQAMPLAGAGHAIGVRSAAHPPAASAATPARLRVRRAQQLRPAPSHARFEALIKPGTREQRLADYMNNARAKEKPQPEQKQPGAQPRRPAKKADALELTLRELHGRSPDTAIAIRALLLEGALSKENAKLLAARSNRVQRIFLRVYRDPGFLRQFEARGINELATMLCKIGGVGKKEPEVAKLFGSRGEEILRFLMNRGFARLHGHDNVVYLNRI